MRGQTAAVEKCVLTKMAEASAFVDTARGYSASQCVGQIGLSTTMNVNSRGMLVGNVE